ncbi:MAG TPA: ribokinase [Anaerolineales bacterium]|nr:ribokinase [Anaerolineales bacterium]
MGKITVLGSINMDVVVLTPQHPRAGETVFGSGVRFIPGGKGANQAVAAARLVDGVGLAGKLGQDAFGDSLHEFLQSERLDLHVTRSETAPSGTALITVDDNGENRIIVVSGANMELSPNDIELISIGSGDLLASVFEVPQETIKTAFERARAAGARTILNPAPASPFVEGLRELCDFLVVNETELAFYAGTDSVFKDDDGLRRQLREVRAGDGQTVIATLGAQGAAYLDRDELVRVPGREVRAVDTTGAGDCFTGALAAALSEGKTVAQAVAFANTAASLSVQVVGASASLPDRAAVERVLELPRLDLT